MPCSSAQACNASDASCHCTGSALPPAGSATNASRWAGSVRRFSSGYCAASALPSATGTGLAPFDRAVAVGADLTPVDTERRTFAPGQPRQRPVAEDRDELLPEHPCALRVCIALQAQQAAFGHLSGGDLVHDHGSLSAQSGDEVGGEFAACGVGRFGLPPVLGDASRGSLNPICRPRARLRPVAIAPHLVLAAGWRRPGREGTLVARAG
jgi:hypothetical protein